MYILSFNAISLFENALPPLHTYKSLSLSPSASKKIEATSSEFLFLENTKESTIYLLSCEINILEF